MVARRSADGVGGGGPGEHQLGGGGGDAGGGEDRLGAARADQRHGVEGEGACPGRHRGRDAAGGNTRDREGVGDHPVLTGLLEIAGRYPVVPGVLQVVDQVVVVTAASSSRSIGTRRVEAPRLRSPPRGWRRPARGPRFPRSGPPSRAHRRAGAAAGPRPRHRASSGVGSTRSRGGNLTTRPTARCSSRPTWVGTTRPRCSNGVERNGEGMSCCRRSASPIP